mmetsp:Transcript_59802/g.177230  ORF Transcript_59802/g.177230 Transcript_59802/m.177230 type:complete len:423 (-) Transcript_59802:674-1942(-)
MGRRIRIGPGRGGILFGLQGHTGRRSAGVEGGDVRAQGGRIGGGPVFGGRGMQIRGILHVRRSGQGRRGRFPRCRTGYDRQPEGVEDGDRVQPPGRFLRGGPNDARRRRRRARKGHRRIQLGRGAHPQARGSGAGVRRRHVPPERDQHVRHGAGQTHVGPSSHRQAGRAGRADVRIEALEGVFPPDTFDRSERRHVRPGEGGRRHAPVFVREGLRMQTAAGDDAGDGRRAVHPRGIPSHDRYVPAGTGRDFDPSDLRRRYAHLGSGLFAGPSIGVEEGGGRERRAGQARGYGQSVRRGRERIAHRDPEGFDPTPAPGIFGRGEGRGYAGKGDRRAREGIQIGGRGRCGGAGPRRMGRNVRARLAARTGDARDTSGHVPIGRRGGTPSRFRGGHDVPPRRKEQEDDPRADAETQRVSCAEVFR